MGKFGGSTKSKNVNHAGQSTGNYEIRRSYAPHLNKEPKTIKSGVTLKEAQAHTNDPRTRKEGKYFDFYNNK